jgi:hypothetical protein
MYRHSTIAVAPLERKKIIVRLVESRETVAGTWVQAPSSHNKKSGEEVIMEIHKKAQYAHKRMKRPVVRRRVAIRLAFYLAALSILLLLHRFIGEFVTATATMAATIFHLSGFVDDLAEA